MKDADQSLVDVQLGTPTASASDVEARMERFCGAVNDATKYVIARYTTFALVSVYLAITVASTTDEQILRGSSLPLPLLGANLPIRPFYVLVPPFYLLLHADLLAHLCVLSGKLKDFENAMLRLGVERRGETKRLIDPFPFNQAWLTVGSSASVRSLLRASVVALVVLVPLVVLCMTQRQFLSSHESGVSLFHRSLVLADLILIRVYWRHMWPDLRFARSTPVDAITTTETGGCGDANARRPWLRPLRSFRAAAVSGWRHVGREWRGWRALWSVGTAALFFSWVLAVVPDSPAEHPLSDTSESGGWRQRFKRISERIDELRQHPASLRLVHPHLQLQGRLLLARDPDRELLAEMAADRDRNVNPDELEGLDLRGRDLRFADFSGCRLFHAKLHESDLSYAKFEDADLRGAKFLDENLAKKHEALLNGELYETFRTSVRAATVLGAKFNHANMAGADLRGLDLRGSEWKFCVAIRADLSHARLGHADLTGAVLRSAILVGTRFDESCILDVAKLECADLTRATFEGADLSGATLVGAKLEDAHLRFVRLSGANLIAADLTRTNVRVADLTTATFGTEIFTDGATWVLANFQKANLDTSVSRSRWYELSTKYTEAEPSSACATRIWNRLEARGNPVILKKSDWVICDPSDLFGRKCVRGDRLDDASRSDIKESAVRDSKLMERLNAWLETVPAPIAADVRDWLDMPR